MTTGARWRSEAGFTLFEMLITTGLIVVITSGVFSLLNPSYGTFQAQPEVSDMQQRMRVAADAVQKDLVMAGAGTYSGAMVGTLDNFFAPILPHKVGTINPDPAGTFTANPLCPDTCTSAITIMYVPTTNSQTSLATDMPTPSAELKVNQQAGCPEDAEELCGFTNGDRVLIFDPSGAYDIFTITNVQDSAIHLQHRDDKFTTEVRGRRLDHEGRVAHLLSEPEPGAERLPAPSLRRVADRFAGRRQRRRFPRRVLRRAAAAAADQAGARRAGSE